MINMMLEIDLWYALMNDLTLFSEFIVIIATNNKNKNRNKMILSGKRKLK